MKYFDTSYLGRLYLQDDGWEKVRELAREDSLCCALLGKAEVLSSFHRKFREGVFDESFLSLLLKQFSEDCKRGAYRWLPVSEMIIERLSKTYGSLPKEVALRSGDGIHLACAAENGFSEIFSNDRRFLIAAPYFGLKGTNII